MGFRLFARRFANAINKKQIALGVGAIAAATGYSIYQAPAENSCRQAIRSAYRKFMPLNDYPDLSKHNNCLANHLTPQLYAKLRDLVSIK